MNARHIEKRTEMFMGEELVYFVTVFDEPIPATDDTNPYGELGRCYAKPETPIRPVVVAPVVARRVPSKPEYIRLFALAGSLPKCVRERRRGAVVRMVEIVRHFRGAMGGLPGRFARLIDEVDEAGIVGAYDAGRLAKMRCYFDSHRSRRADFEARAVREWERAFAKVAD